MKNLVFGLIVFGFATQGFTQEIALAEVELVANHNYLNVINTESVALPVKKLENEVLKYNIKDSGFEYERGETYQVTFSLPEGKIIAAYNDEGTLLSTEEKYKNVKLPSKVIYGILEKYPNWAIINNTYYVNYHNEKGVTKRLYKIRLVNDEKSLAIKADEKGNFI
ncbi:nicotinate-nucleotide adenylyltransferase [Mariniflexile ostreae]|uniref:Nicotinate-nucleotide adenylyltransferase n=1 Tax=Mariniflexile ostreae TaxID=1520892 RepID=A0ABV5FAK0_9FLAO